MSHFQSSRSLVQMGRLGSRTPALLHRTWTVPKESAARTASRSTWPASDTSVGTATTRRTPLESVSSAAAAEAVALDVGHHHVHALAPEAPAHAEADPAGGPGDDGGAACEGVHEETITPIANWRRRRRDGAVGPASWLPADRPQVGARCNQVFVCGPGVPPSASRPTSVEGNGIRELPR